VSTGIDTDEEYYLMFLCSMMSGGPPLATYNTAPPTRYRLESGTRRTRFIRNAARNFGVDGELISFCWSKRWWLVPVVVTLFLLVALIALAQSSAIAPFIYTVF
jgi:hypothetical protein